MDRYIISEGVSYYIYCIYGFSVCIIPWFITVFWNIFFAVVCSFLNGLLFLISMVLMFDKAIKDRQAKMERVASLEVDEVRWAADGDDYRVFEPWRILLKTHVRIYIYSGSIYIYIGIYIVVQNCFGGSISILYFSPIQIDVSFFGAFHNPNWLFWGFGGIFLWWRS